MSRESWEILMFLLAAIVNQGLIWLINDALQVGILIVFGWTLFDLFGTFLRLSNISRKRWNPHGVSVTEALPGSNCVVMRKVADARGDGGVIFLGSLLTQTCQRKPWALSVPGSFLGFGERKFLDKVVGRLWIGWIIELPNEFYLQHTALTVDDITWACCGLLVNHEQNL